jgi:hypothetical protein
MSKNKGAWGVDKRRAREEKKALKRVLKQQRRKDKAKSEPVRPQLR